METHARYILIGLFVIVASLAGFGFVYWLHATGGLGERTIYRVRFENTVSGLRTGAAVSFNGIRVGEVTNLQLNPGNPGQVFVTIAIDTGTPVRSDTQARIDVQGLMGSPSIALSGGSPNLPAPVASKGEPPLLVADASAGQDLTQTAREVLGRIDKISRRKFQFASRHDREFRYVFRGPRAQFERHRHNPRWSREDIWRRGVEGPSAHIRFDRSANCRCTFQKARQRACGRRSNDLGQERHAKNHCRRKRRTKLVLGQCAMGR